MRQSQNLLTIYKGDRQDRIEGAEQENKGVLGMYLQPLLSIMPSPACTLGHF